MYNVERENDMIAFIFSICDEIGGVSCDLERCNDHIRFHLYNPDTRQGYNIMLFRDQFAAGPEEELEAGKENIRIAIFKKLLKEWGSYYENWIIKYVWRVWYD